MPVVVTNDDGSCHVEYRICMDAPEAHHEACAMAYHGCVHDSTVALGGVVAILIGGVVVATWLLSR